MATTVSQCGNPNGHLPHTWTASDGKEVWCPGVQPQR